MKCRKTKLPREGRGSKSRVGRNPLHPGYNWVFYLVTELSWTGGSGSCSISWIHVLPIPGKTILFLPLPHKSPTPFRPKGFALQMWLLCPVWISEFPLQTCLCTPGAVSRVYPGNIQSPGAAPVQWGNNAKGPCIILPTSLSTLPHFQNFSHHLILSFSTQNINMWDRMALRNNSSLLRHQSQLGG